MILTVITAFLVYGLYLLLTSKKDKQPLSKNSSTTSYSKEDDSNLDPLERYNCPMCKDFGYAYSCENCGSDNIGFYMIGDEPEVRCNDCKNVDNNIREEICPECYGTSKKY